MLLCGCEAWSLILWGNQGVGGLIMLIQTCVVLGVAAERVNWRGLVTATISSRARRGHCAIKLVSNGMVIFRNPWPCRSSDYYYFTIHLIRVALKEISFKRSRHFQFTNFLLIFLDFKVSGIWY